MVWLVAENIIELISRSFDMNLSFHLLNLRVCHIFFTPHKVYGKTVINTPIYIEDLMKVIYKVKYCKLSSY